ncbi:beta-1 adrenergic receptor-like [Montipora capricornis]|uniref:beta-1 adrenergic receptor-like n=1 Tax=Montipora foliosa TaxID=591990 RepID=UPI0035F124B5
MSLLGLYPCENVTAPTYLSFSSASTAILLGIVTTVGNFLVVMAVLLDPNKDLRSPFSVFVANLGLADLVVGLIVSPMAAVYLISEGLNDTKLNQANKQFRIWRHIPYFISCTASLLSLTALALDRYIAITYPLHYRSKLSPVRAFTISCLIWIVSVLLTLIYFLVGYDNFRFVFANTAVVVAFAVLIFTNVKIFKFLRREVRHWDSLHDSSEENAVKKQAVKREKKITKTLVIILALFSAFYVPSWVCVYIINFCATCDCIFIHWVRDIQFILVIANSGVNPFVYAWRLENFRKAFKSILTCRAFSQRLRAINFPL